MIPLSEFGLPTMTRREKIEAMLAEDPSDVFLRYSLAMELDKEGNHEASLTKFAELMRDDPPYVPAFFMAAQQLVRLGRQDEARSMLRNGIAAARSQGDLHAASEMNDFLSSLG
jgi:thioredoxin-like negative regulator of GroEL